MSEALWVGLGAIVVNIILAVIAGVYALSKNNEHIMEKVDAKILQEKTAINKGIEFVHNEVKLLNNELDEKVKWCGEGMTVIRNKIMDTELWNRDNFVSKPTFGAVIAKLEEGMNRLADKMDEGFNKLDEKLEKFRQ